MPREFGPTRFESLSQASNARAAMIEAARAAVSGGAGAKTFPDLRLLEPEFRIEPIHNIYPLEASRPERNSATPLRLRLAAAGALGLAFLAACGGGAKGGSNHEFTPTPNNPSPTVTECPPGIGDFEFSITPDPGLVVNATEILCTETTSTLEPTATLLPEPTATAERLVTAHDITENIKEIQSLIQTDIPLIENAEGLENSVNIDDPRDAQGTLNGYGRMAKAIGDNICNLGVKQQNVIETWLMIKTFFRDYGMRLESLERLPSGGTSVLLNRYFNNPGCAALEGQ